MEDIVLILQFLMVGFMSKDACCASDVPAVINRHDSDPVRNCNGECRGQWAQWTSWGDCSEGECHLEYGRQTRQTYCYVITTAAPSRSDGGSRNKQPPQHSWEVACKQIQHKTCVHKRSCNGEWSNWGIWTDCESTESEASCSRSRRRICKDVNGKRLPGSHCFGGASNDTIYEECHVKACKGNIRKYTVQPLPAVASTKPKHTGLSYNTILIICVAIGSVVFGAMFVLLLMKLVRRPSGRDDDSTSSFSSRWKRIGSTNTSSTGYSAGYVAASDVMSPRPELRNLQSPGCNTSDSGSSAGSQVHFFGRSNSNPPTQTELPPASGLLTVSGALSPKENGERPRRSRLLHENIYWEITDNLAREEATSTSDVSLGAEQQPIPAEPRVNSPNNDREVVQNVLYGTMV